MDLLVLFFCPDLPFHVYSCVLYQNAVFDPLLTLTDPFSKFDLIGNKGIIMVPVCVIVHKKSTNIVVRIIFIFVLIAYLSKKKITLHLFSFCLYPYKKKASKSIKKLRNDKQIDNSVNFLITFIDKRIADQFWIEWITRPTITR